MKTCFLLLALVVGLSLVKGADPVAAAPDRQGRVVIHVVEYGESVFTLADRYGIPVEVILRRNGLSDSTQIYVGFPLVIPVAPEPANQPQRPANQSTAIDSPPDRSPGCAHYHTVRPGETPAGIAQDYGVTVVALRRWNGLSQEETIYPGQELCTPLPSSQPAAAKAETGQSAAPPAPYYHPVAAGETLLMISLRYGVGYLQIKEANELDNADIILPGQRLLIPGYQPPQTNQAEPAAEPPATETKPAETAGPAEPAEKPAGEAAGEDEPAAEAETPAGEAAGEDEPAAEAETPVGQTISELMALPRAKGPLTLKVNDGATWVKDDEVFTEQDPEDITRLVVSTGDETGHTVRVRNGGYEVRGQSEFIINHLAPAGYEVWIEEPEAASKTAFVEVEAARQNYVDFSRQPNFEPQRFASPDGWVLADWRNPSQLDQRLGGWSNIIVRTPSDGLLVKIESEGGGYQSACITGSKGGGACDFPGLNAAFYTLWIEGTDFKIETYMDGDAYAEFTLAQQPAEGE